jgi:hypothetical protein
VDVIVGKLFWPERCCSLENFGIGQDLIQQETIRAGAAPNKATANDKHAWGCDLCGDFSRLSRGGFG